ncbi:MAG: ribonuclease III [Burkholderiales bacterium]|nr:ribonuclease III [Opitutaceae bacterium]
MDPLVSLQTRLGHVFANPAVLREAITHPSYFYEHPTEGPHNQRLEFLGDAVLQLIITEAIYARFPAEPEGVLSRHRAALTNGRHLAHLSLELGLDAALLLGGSEASTGGRARASNLEDVFEALVGALQLDAGPTRTREIVLAAYGPLGPRLALGLQDNPKGRLQELIQPTHGTTPLRYETAQIAGPDHAREFASKVFLGERLLGEGGGPSKKAAEEAAARAALATGL